MKKIILILMLLNAVIIPTAYAGLMKAVANELSYGSWSGGDIVENNNNDFNRTLTALYDSSSSHVSSQVWAGASDGQGDSNKWQGGFDSIGEFNIDDIVISYTGEEPLVSNQINGSYHITSFVDVLGSLGHSYFDIVLRGQHGGNYFNSSTGNDLVNNLFTWNINSSFTLNQAFSLRVSSHLLVSNILLEGGFVGSGNYKTALGGSPVFILPTGYTANSADGTIVNNYYVAHNPFNIATPVPEPSTSILLMIAALIFFTQLKRELSEKKYN